MKKTKYKLPRSAKIALILIATILAALLIVALFAGISLVIKYFEFSYENRPPVERTDEYTLPPYPDFDTESLPDDTTQEPTDTDFPSDTTQGPDVTASPDETSAPAADTTEPAETTKPVETTKPAETTWPGGTAPSFENSSHVVSVWGKTPIYKVEQKDPDIVNILVFATDSRNVAADRGRSDAMIVVSYNKKTSEIKLTSIMRDSLVPLEGYGWTRMNNAYFFGGVGLAVNTVNQLFDLDIQQFVVIDFNGVQKFIDRLGSVNLTLTKSEASYYNQLLGTNLTEGANQCNTAVVMEHIRNRSSLAGDFDRVRRQQDTVKAIADKIIKEKSLVEIYDLTEYVLKLVKTNIPLGELLSYASSLFANTSDITISTQSVPYRDAFEFRTYKGMEVIYFDIQKAATRVNKFIYG